MKILRVIVVAFAVVPATAVGPLLAAESGVPYGIINRGETDHDREPCVSLRLDGEVTEIVPRSVDDALS